MAELDPFPEVTQHSGIHGQSRSQGQLSTAIMEQTQGNLLQNASSSRKANLPIGTANTVVSHGIYSGGYPFGYTQQNISYSKPTRVSGSVLEELQHSTYSVGHPFRYTPPGTSYPAYPSPPLEEKAHKRFDRPYSLRDGLEQPSQRLSDFDSPSESDHKTASSLKKRKRISRAQQTSPSKRSRTAYTSQGEPATTSVSAQLGTSMGSDRRQRAETRVENGVLFGLVDNEWSKFERLEFAPNHRNSFLAEPAGYHLDFRMRLILKDAQQPGAPVPPSESRHSTDLGSKLMILVFQQGIPPNYTSYSPITQGWNDDNLRSMRDSQGRHAFLMPDPPPDWQHNPYSGYMMYNGLVMLDQNNRPVKDYPGAPLTVSYDAKASLIEGLRRYFGMTYSDIIGRMPPQRYTSTGIRPIRGVTLLSTRTGRWYNRHKGSGLGPWFDRGGGR